MSADPVDPNAKSITSTTPIPKGEAANISSVVPGARENYQVEYKAAKDGAKAGVERDVVEHLLAMREHGKAAGMDEETVHGAEKDVWRDYYTIGMFQHQNNLRNYGDDAPQHLFNLGWYRRAISSMAGIATEQLQEDNEKLDDLRSEGNFNQMRISAQTFLDDSLTSYQSGVDTLGWGAAYLGSLL